VLAGDSGDARLIGGGGRDRRAATTPTNPLVVAGSTRAGGIGAEGQLASGRFRLGSAVDADERILYTVTGTGDARVSTPSHDQDGSGAAAAVAFALLTGGRSLPASDILVL
jgi:hypothetical protein